jgi:cytochrome c-type biogenesis protein CcmH
MDVSVGFRHGHRNAEIRADDSMPMVLWILFALMTALAIFAVLLPLARARAKHHSGSDLEVYRDQLAEIQRDRVAGQIGEAEAEAARIEVSRRLIGAADAEAASAAAPALASATWHRRVVAVIALVVLPLGAGALYLKVGSPDLPGQPLSARATEIQDHSIEHLIAQVEGHLAANPDDARGWEVIAPVYLRLGRYDDAVKARRKVLRLAGESAARQADLGEALVGTANGIVTAEAKSAFERAVVLDPQDVKSRYFLGLAAEQDGHRDAAAATWRSMLASAPAGADWAGFVRNELARVEGGPGPGPGDVAAANNMSDDQRMTMIRGMVAKLADQLHKDGSDLEGWLRLVRSYNVLGEKDKALAAAGDARQALAGDPEKLRRIEEAVKDLK